MTSDQTDESTQTDEINQEQSEIFADSVFLVIKDEKGNFGVSTDINAKLNVSKIATIADIKHGCRDISSIISAREISKLVSDAIKSEA